MRTPEFELGFDGAAGGCGERPKAGPKGECVARVIPLSPPINDKGASKAPLSFIDGGFEASISIAGSTSGRRPRRKPERSVGVNPSLR